MTAPDAGAESIRRDGSAESLRREGGTESVRREGGTESVRREGGTESVRREGGTESVRREGGAVAVEAAATAAAPMGTTTEPTGFVAPRYSHQQIVTVITGIILCILLAALDQTVVIPAVPAIAADLNGFGHLSWIVTAYLLTSTAATPIYGKLSDIWGRRALLIPAIVLFIIASVACALSRSLWQLIAFRALQGIGGAGLMSMAQAAIADVVSPRERGRYQGYMAGMWGVASVAGPTVGGYMTEHLSWRSVFWINVPLGIVAIVLCNRGLRLLKVERRPARIDVLGAVLLIGGVTCWLLLLSWGGLEYPWNSAPIYELGVGGVVLLAALAVHERRDRDPLLPPRMFGNPVFVAGVALAFLASLGLFAGTFMLPLFFQLLRGADAGASGLLVMPFLVTNTIGAYAAGSLARKLGHIKPITVAGFALAMAGFALLGTMGPHTSTPVACLDMVVVGLGIGICMPSILVTVQNAAEQRDVGAATGALLLLRSMGGAFGSTVAGALLLLRFNGALEAAGVHQHLDIGAVTQAGGLHGLGAGAQAVAVAGMSSGFHLTFWTCAVLMAVGLAITLGTRDLPLRTVPASQAQMGH